MRSLRLIAWLLPFVAASASADEPAELGDGPDPDCVSAVHGALRVEALAAAEPVRVREPRPEPATRPTPRVVEPPTEVAIAEPTAPAPDPAALDLPRGRAIGQLGAASCLALLQAAGVEHERVPASEAAGVRIPVRLQGPVAGVTLRSRDDSPIHEIMDCRLAVAVLVWAPRLRRRGVSELTHYSAYRPGARVAGTRRVSGHARGLALDLARVTVPETELDVETGWTARARGQAPCHGTFDEPARSAQLRRLVCDAAAQDLFQVVLTPHYDAAHGNHVHLELVPDVTWSFVH